MPDAFEDYAQQVGVETTPTPASTPPADAFDEYARQQSTPTTTPSPTAPPPVTDAFDAYAQGAGIKPSPQPSSTPETDQAAGETLHTGPGLPPTTITIRPEPGETPARAPGQPQVLLQHPGPPVNTAGTEWNPMHEYIRPTTLREKATYALRDLQQPGSPPSPPIIPIDQAEYITHLAGKGAEIAAMGADQVTPALADIYHKAAQAVHGLERYPFLSPVTGYGAELLEGSADVLDIFRNANRKDMVTGIETSLANQLSEASSPEAIAGLVAQIVDWPVFLPAFVADRVLGLPVQWHRVAQSIRDKGLWHPDTWQTITDEGTADVMALAGYLGLHHLSLNPRRAARQNMMVRQLEYEMARQKGGVNANRPDQTPGAVSTQQRQPAVPAAKGQVQAGDTRQKVTFTPQGEIILAPLESETARVQPSAAPALAPEIIQVAPSGSTSEDMELKPGFKQRYPKIAWKAGDKVWAQPSGNHADLAKKLGWFDTGYPADAIPGFLDTQGKFVYQHEDDLPPGIRSQRDIIRDRVDEMPTTKVIEEAEKVVGKDGLRARVNAWQESRKEPYTPEEQAYKLEQAAREVVTDDRLNQERSGLGPGAASRQEFINRYKLLGASKLVEGHTELGDWSRQMLMDEPSIPHDQLKEVFDQSKQLINNLETAGRTRSQIADFINQHIGAGRGREKPVWARVRPMTELKRMYRAIERAQKIARAKGAREQSLLDRQRYGEQLRALRIKTQDAIRDLKQRIRHSDKWLAGDQERVRRDMLDFVNHVLPPELRHKFTNRITRVLRRRPLGSDPGKIYRDAFNVMKDIETEWRKMTSRNLRDEIEGLYHDILNSKSVSVEVRPELRALFDNVQMEKPGITRSSAERLRRYEAAGNKLPLYLKERLANFYRQPLSDLSLEELEALRANTWMLRELGKDLWKDKKMERMAEKEALTDALALAITHPIEPLEKLARVIGVKSWQRISDHAFNMVKGGLDWASAHEKVRTFMERLYQWMDRSENGWLTNHVLFPFYDADRFYLLDRGDAIDGARAIARKWNLGVDDRYAIGIWAHLMQEGSKEELLKYNRDPALPKLIDHVEKNGLTQGQQEYYDFGRNYFDREIPALARFFADNYNQELKYYDNYWPRYLDPRHVAEWRFERLKYKHPVTGEDIDINEFAKEMRGWVDYNYRTRNIRKGLSKARLIDAKIPINLDAFATFEKHVDQWSYLKNFQPKLNMIGEIAHTGLFAQKYGKVGTGFVLDHLDTVARNGKYARETWEYALDALRNQAMVGTLGFRLNQFKHLANYPLGFYEAGGANWWWHGFRASKSIEGYALIQRLFPEILHAFGGDLTIQEASEYAHLPDALRTASFSIDRILDYQNRASTALGYYFKLLDRNGFDWTNYHNLPDQLELVNEARRAYTNAVGSPSVISRPLLVSKGTTFSNKPSIARAWMAYQTPKMVRWGALRSAILDDALRHGKYAQGITKSSLVVASSLMESGVRLGSKSLYILGAHALLNAMDVPFYQRHYEESAMRELLVEAANDLVTVPPMVGQPFSTAIQLWEHPTAEEFITRRTTVPVLDTIDQTSADFWNTVRHNNLRNTIQFAGDVLQVGGVPASIPMQVLKQAADEANFKSQRKKDREQMRLQLHIPKGQRIY